MKPIKTFEHNGFTIEIHTDECSDSPRETQECLATLACWHPEYRLGDRQIPYMTGPELMNSVPDILALLPIYLYDHGGITVNTVGFTCSFDSGQVGWGYITKSGLDRAGYGASDASIMTIVKEVEEYADFLTGNVYGYIIKRDGAHVDGCWGFYCDLQEVADSAIESVNSLTQDSNDGV